MNAKVAASTILLAAKNCFRPSYLRCVARASRSWHWEAMERPLKRVQLSSLLREPHDLRLFQCPQVYGEAPPADLLAVATLAKACRPTSAFEFGTFRGQMTVNIAMNSPADSTVYTLDLPPEFRPEVDGWDGGISDGLIGHLYRQTEHAGRIRQLFADSRRFDTAPYRGAMDFVFVDACHEYEFVRNDSEKAFEMLAADGTVVWHDYGSAYPGVRRYLESLAREREVFWVEGTQVAFCRGRG